MEASVADGIADTVKIIHETGPPARSDSMHTTIEDEWHDVMDAPKRATDTITTKHPHPTHHQSTHLT
ncbi:thiamine-binding protein [Streptomyces sp. NBC_00400]|uniref:thiamine-binding protein n=1 Tax=Streptomyces sp. NBC_00400 TaxID=2975737 RepID=UPI003FA787D1